MKLRFVLSTLALCGALCGAAPALAGTSSMVAEDAPKAFTIVGARVFDGERWLPAGTQVRVQHGLVPAVGPDVGLPRGGVLIDASGKTLLPEDVAADSKTADAGCGHGAIVTGAYADLRLVEGTVSEDWKGMGDIVARWKSGVLIGGHRKGGVAPF